MVPATIMIASSSHPWDDPRILYRQALSLAKVYRVELHAVAPFREKWYQGIRVVGLPARGRWLRPLQWLTLGKRALRSRARLFHFHDPDLLPLAMFLRLCGRQTVYDVHEAVPEDISAKAWLPSFLRPLIRGLYRLTVAAAQPGLGAIVTASSAIAGAYRHPRLVVIQNHPPLELFAASNGSRPAYRQGQTLRLIYSGSLQPSRGIREILAACGHLPENFDYHLDIIGKESALALYGEDIRPRTEPLASRVTFHGWLQLPEVVDRLRQAHLGLVCTLPNAADPLGSPLKLFEYMAAGLGLVVSDIPQWRPWTEGYAACARVDAARPEAIAAGILQVAGILSRNGHQTGLREAGAVEVGALQSRFSWQRQERRLLDLYTQLLPKGSAA